MIQILSWHPDASWHPEGTSRHVAAVRLDTHARPQSQHLVTLAHALSRAPRAPARTWLRCPPGCGLPQKHSTP